MAISIPMVPYASNKGIGGKKTVESQVGPGDPSGMIRMASCQGQGFLVTVVTAFTGAAALGEEGMPVL